MLTEQVESIIYPPSGGITIQWKGGAQEELSRDQIDAILADLDYRLPRLLMLAYWKARSSDYSDSSQVVGKTIELDMASNLTLLDIG